MVDYSSYQIYLTSEPEIGHNRKIFIFKSKAVLHRMFSMVDGIDQPATSIVPKFFANCV